MPDNGLLPSIEGMKGRQQGLLKDYYTSYNNQPESPLQAALEKRRLKLAETRIKLKPQDQPLME